MAKGENVSLPAAINTTQSGAGNVQVIIPCQSRKTVMLGLAANQAAQTLVSTIAAWISFDYIDPGNGDPAGVTAAEGRATWHAWTTGLANPASGVALDSMTAALTIACNAIRIRSTWVSGSGPILLQAGLLNV